MKPSILSTARLSFPLATAIAALLVAQSASALTYYWDSDGSTAGFGSTTGTWGTNAFWTTVAGGGATHTAVTNTLAADIVNFGSPTLNYGNANVGIATGGVTATSIVFGLGQTTAITLGTAGGGAITLGGATRTIVANSSGHTINAPIILTGATTVSVNVASTATHSLTLGAMSGTGGLTLQNIAGTNPTALFILNGASTYTGNTLLNSTNSNASVILRLGVNDALPTTTVLTIDGGNGTGSGRTISLDMNGKNQTLAGLTNTSVSSRTQRVFSSSAAILTVNDSGSRTFSGLIGNGGTNITLVKEGAGIWTLSGANSYIGLTTVNGGGLRIQHATGLGATSGDSVVNGSATGSTGNARIELSGGITVGAGESLTISGAGFFTGALTSFSGSNEWTGAVTIGLAGTRLGTTAGANTLKVSGAIDSGILTTGLAIRNGDALGTVILSGASSYLGDTNLFTGKLQLDGGNDRLPVGTMFSLGLSGANVVEFDLNGRNQEIAGLTVNAGATAANNSVNNSSGTLSTLTVNTAASPSIYGGILKGNLGLTKEGANSLTLTGTNNNYTGATDVNDGTLIVDGNISTSLLTTVKDGATLGGTGTVGALTVDLGGTLAPGNSPGILDVNGAYIQNGTLSLELNGTVAGSLSNQHDQVNVTGSVTLNGLLAATVGYVPAINDLLFILLNDDLGSDAITGTFTGLAQGDTVSLGGYNWQISYTADSVGGTFLGGNDVALLAVPEPGAALLGSLGVLALLRRRRN